MIGIVLLVIGILLFAVAAVLPQTGSQTIPAGAGWELTPTAIGGEALTLSWSNGGSGTNVTLYDCGSTCPATIGSGLSSVATGHGGSGSLSVSVDSGHQYLFVETAGTATLSASYSAVGLTVLGVIGIVVAALGTVIVLLPPKREARGSMADGESA